MIEKEKHVKLVGIKLVTGSGRLKVSKSFVNFPHADTRTMFWIRGRVIIEGHNEIVSGYGLEHHGRW
ncbi:MAG: hypothetical protein AAGJ81_09550 [Verrucomicrobiota bacterium]